MTAEQLDELKEAFNLFDKDHDGTITLEELSGVLQALGIKPVADELQIMMNSVDLDQNGVIDFGEFCELMRTHLYAEGDEPNEDDELTEAFRVFDTNGDGYISEEELKQALLNLGEQLTGSELKDMIKAADKDGNGKIDYAEFVAMMRNK